MEMTKIVQSVYDRLKADTGAGGLFNTTTPLIDGVYAFRAGSQITQGDSYITFFPNSASSTDDFDNNVLDWSMSVAVYVDPQQVTGVGLSAIIDRVYARLHDWTPTLSGWSAAGPWVLTDAGAPELPDEDSLQFIMNFQIFASKARG